MFSQDGNVVYYTQGNDKGILDLWKHNLSDNTLKQLSFFTRDSYEPAISNKGTVIFKLQDYRILIAIVSGGGGQIQTLTGFQSEIPYWHPNGKRSPLHMVPGDGG